MPDKIIKNFIKNPPANTPPLKKEMIKVLGKRIDQKDMEAFDPVFFQNMIDSHWQLAKSRKPKESKISIYCPIDQGAKARTTIIDIVNDDLAFLLDSVVAEINRHNLLIHFLIHPTINIKRGPLKKITDISHDEKDTHTRQSHIHIQIKEIVSEELLTKLEHGLHEVLTDAYATNRDWKPMLEKLKEAKNELKNAKNLIPKAAKEEHCAFLDYLYNHNFTLLGYREYEFIGQDKNLKSRIVKGQSLGLLCNDLKPAFINDKKERLPRNLQNIRRNLPPVFISKTNRFSTVHRRVPMDAISIKTYDENGQVKGEKLLLGLFTSVTYSRSVQDVPYLRKKVKDTIESSGFRKGSHDRKALSHILEKYPRDELFQIPLKELSNTCLSILRLQERQRIALFIRRDPFGRYISCITYIPRDRFRTALRKDIGEILEKELQGNLLNFYTSLDDSVFARVIFIVKVDLNNPPKYNPDQIERKVQAAGQTWAEKITTALLENSEDAHNVKHLTLKYGDSFPIGYQYNYTPARAVADIHKIEETIKTEKIQLDLYKTSLEEKNQLKLKVYSPRAPLTLSEVLPILDHMGLKAISELPFEIEPANTDHSVWIHDFLLDIPDNKKLIKTENVKKEFEQAFIKIHSGEMESDLLNQLVLKSNLNWRYITVLRAYVRYLKQLRFGFGRNYVEKALTQHPILCRKIVELFKILHDPSLDHEDRKTLLKKQKQSISKSMQTVDSLDHDRIIRTFQGLVTATLRTNFFQTDITGNPKPYLSMKLDCAAIPELPAPKPFREIFVYSPRVEGIHLRGDKIARGGLRWSDRHEDFRTEILGLMKAQMVKNALIVPMGSKGGFVVKSHISDRKAYIEEGIECYKTFIRGLLDITDNRQGTQIIRPENVVCIDPEDPYLVVAADKGTATFSDIANSLAEDYNFWLGDAFASGGSAGYDHKKMGITAKGAWESVKMHFQTLNHNTQTQDFEVIGVGDMGGDVFGNGMLLSKHIKLIGAFNHLHIFCDPNPDTTSSHKERNRLFNNILGWDHYDTKKLSPGGRIYSRADKSLKLTPEIQKRFDIKDEKVSPIDLIQAMLKARTDLLWFGGIGTYIKSSNETNDDVGDKANDSLRVIARDIRAKVISEGANLGVTQLGRIELATNGVELNTDFLDNSGGVNSSDYEVNIKILLSDVMSQKKHNMSLKARNKLLGEMTDEIADLVLRNNYQQAQSISLCEMQSPEQLPTQENFIQTLERESGFNRQLEGLPDDDEIDERLRHGKGLTRPELCILLSYAKIGFTQDLLNSDLPDDPDMESWLIHYFPQRLQKKYETEIKRHRLNREIIATTMANSFVNRMGPTFLNATMKRTGSSASEIAKAYIIVRKIFNLREIWDAIEALDNKTLKNLQLKAMCDIAELSEHSVMWFLTRLGRDPILGQDMTDYSENIKMMRKNINKILTPNLKKSLEEQTSINVTNGLPENIAYEIATIPILFSACDIVRISLEHKSDLIKTAKIYFEVGEHFHLDWLRNQGRFMAHDNYWEAEALEGSIEHLYTCQAGLTKRILKDTECEKTGNKNLFKYWLENHSHLTDQLDPLFTKLKRAGTIDLPMLVTAEQRLRNLYGG